MNSYTVQPGMSLWDVVLNATGSLTNLDAICAYNGYSSWTPDLPPGTVVLIPDTVVIDSNTLNQLSIYPAVNNITSGIWTAINNIFSILNDLWILSTGCWNDQALWKDTKNWND